MYPSWRPKRGRYFARELALISGALPPAPGSSVEIGEPAQRPQTGHEAVFAAAIDDEGGQSLEVAADWLFRDGEFTAIVTAHQRVLFGGCADEPAIVCPLPLDKLELPVKVRPDKCEYEAAVGAVVLQDTGGQWRAIVGAAPNHAVQAHFADDGRIAGVHPSDVRAKRGLEATRVVAEHEGVVAFWVGTKLRIVLVRGQCQRRATGPAPDDLGGQPLLLGAVFGTLMQVLAEGCYARVQLAEDCVGAVEPQHIGLRYWGDVVGLVLVPQDELASLERHFVRIGAGNAGTLDGRMADAIRETEHVAQVSCGLYVLLPDGHDAGQVA